MSNKRQALNVGDKIVIRKDGAVVSTSRNLRGLRAYCGKVPAHTVSIIRRDHGEGQLAITFENGACCVCQWASFGVLSQSLRTWRTLQGARLLVDGESSGIVSFYNPYLKEHEEEKVNYAQFNHGCEIALTLEQARAASHQGQCEEDVKALCADPVIRAQLEALDPEKIKAELAECGAWDDEALEDREQNFERIVWLAAGQIIDDEYENRRASK